MEEETTPSPQAVQDVDVENLDERAKEKRLGKFLARFKLQKKKKDEKYLPFRLVSFCTFSTVPTFFFFFFFFCFLTQMTPGRA